MGNYLLLYTKMMQSHWSVDRHDVILDVRFLLSFSYYSGLLPGKLTSSLSQLFLAMLKTQCSRWANRSLLKSRAFHLDIADPKANIYIIYSDIYHLWKLKYLEMSTFGRRNSCEYISVISSRISNLTFIFGPALVHGRQELVLNTITLFKFEFCLL